MLLLAQLTHSIRVMQAVESEMLSLDRCNELGMRVNDRLNAFRVRLHFAQSQGLLLSK